MYEKNICIHVRSPAVFIVSAFSLNIISSALSAKGVTEI
jgi:hypothetical protein